MSLMKSTHVHNYRTIEGQSVPECDCGAVRSYDNDSRVQVRKFKFRVWDTTGKVMIYPSPHMNPLYLTLDGRLVEIDREGSEVPAPNYELSISTGIRDKRGREIYEGDILKHHKYGGRHTVEWIKESSGFFVGKQSWPLTNLCSQYVEIVGNVFEDRGTR